MIRINLLPTRGAKKRRGAKAGSSAGQAFVLLALLLIGLEAGGLYYWYDSLDTQLIQANRTVQELDRKVKALQKVKKQIADDEAQRELLEEQNRILERLKDGKVGPPNMLLFLSYALTKPADTLANQKELIALQKAGWNLDWVEDSVWLTKLEENAEGIITIKGEAYSHEDVAEFYQRLRSSIYFRNLEPGPQEREYDQGIEMKFIAFQGSAELNYHTTAPPEEEGEADEGADDKKAKPDGPIVPGTPSIDAVPGAAGASKPGH